MAVQARAIAGMLGKQPEPESEEDNEGDGGDGPDPVEAVEPAVAGSKRSAAVAAGEPPPLLLPLNLHLHLPPFTHILRPQPSSILFCLAAPSIPLPVRRPGTKVPGSAEMMIWGTAVIVSRMEKDPARVDLNYIHLGVDDFAVRNWGGG